MAEKSDIDVNGPVASGADWWRQAAVYQIYPRSFADSDGDGIGDIAGIVDRLPYLVDLGIDAVWLSPFYPSALADGGYDVDDYREVDPRLGSLETFDEMVAALHAAGIKLIVDIVPNHTSNLHEWFVEALASPAGSAARDRYLFRDGIGSDGSEPPSDWESLFGGSAWEPVGDGQFYLHVFAREQPDLNWDDGGVRADFVRTLRFWADRGVDGFRVDVAHGLAKAIGAEVPSKAEVDALDWGAGHPLWDRDEVQEIYAEWRTVFDEYDPPRIGVAEATVDDPKRRARYASPQSLGQAFNFDLLESGFDADSYRDIIERNLRLADESGSSTTWVLSNHDVTRHPTRYGLAGGTLPGQKDAQQWITDGGPVDQLDRDLGLWRARAATLMMLALPGSAYLYQGEELGLHEVAEIPDESRQDPTFFRRAGLEVGRDGCRVPLPWTPTGASLGFGAGGTHLPQPSWFAALSVEAQETDPASTLTMYRTALEWRRRLQSAEALEWVEGSPRVMHFVRPGGWHSVTNFGSEPVALPTGRVAIASGPLDGGLLPSATTAWVVPERKESR